MTIEHRLAPGCLGGRHPPETSSKLVGTVYQMRNRWRLVLIALCIPAGLAGCSKNAPRQAPVVAARLNKTYDLFAVDALQARMRRIRPLIEEILGSDHAEFFIVNNRSEFVGVIHLRQLTRMLVEQDVLQSLVIAKDLLESNEPTVTEDDNLYSVFRAVGHDFTDHPRAQNAVVRQKPEALNVGCHTFKDQQGFFVRIDGAAQQFDVLFACRLSNLCNQAILIRAGNNPNVP